MPIAPATSRATCNRASVAALGSRGGPGEPALKVDPDARKDGRSGHLPHHGIDGLHAHRIPNPHVDVRTGFGRRHLAGAASPHQVDRHLDPRDGIAQGLQGQDLQGQLPARVDAVSFWFEHMGGLPVDGEVKRSEAPPWNAHGPGFG